MEGLISTNVCENEAYYLLAHKNTWQLEQQMPTHSTEAYLSSISHLETIKLENIEDEEGESACPLVNPNDYCYSGILMIEKVDVPVIKKEKVICNNRFTVKSVPFLNAS